MADEESGAPEGPEEDKPMSFFEHLQELRKRLIRAALGVGIGFLGCYAFVDYLTMLIVKPYETAWYATGFEGTPQLQNLGALDAFLTDIRIAFFASLFIAGPVLFYQAWMFISPGLYSKEKRLVIPFVATSAVMFATGAVFCYYFVIPIATEYFLTYPIKKDVGGADVDIVAAYTYAEYTTYTTRLLLGFGLMFEFPLAVYFLAKAGVITHKTLLRYWKISVLLICVASALLTPPDPITLGLMAVPMVALFFISTLVAYFVSKPALAQQARLDAELAAMEDDDDEAAAEGEAEAEDEEDGSDGD